MHNIWIATDLHLYNVENDPRHPFRTQRNLGNLADNYGSDIQDDDLLIFLGDLYDPTTGDAEKVSSIIHNIKGTKIMCRGNHDTESKDFYRELGFDAVCDILRIHNLIFSHKPVRVNPDELNIHGHLHSEKLSSLGYQHINAYPINHNKEDQPVLIEDLIDSAIVQNRDEVHGPSFNQQQMDAFTSLVSNETYRDVLDLSDEFIMSPMDEAVNTKQKKTEAEKLYFLSEHDDWDESIINPRIPNNFLTQRGYEDATIPRVCFSTFIDGCLRALSQNLKGKIFYVYQPVGKYEVIKPTLEQVPDRAVTRERWITKPVELHCIGKIQVGEAKGDGIKYVYGEDNEHSAMLYDWEWEWIEKIDESVQPSIVSLSASEKDPRAKRDIMDEILFPDVDSTRFFEADDNAPEAEADQKKTHKMLDKNDVAADGQTTLDEGVFGTKVRVTYPEPIRLANGERSNHEDFAILAKDLFHEQIMIHPELIDNERIAVMKEAKELIAYLNEITASQGLDVNGEATDDFTAGGFILNALRNEESRMHPSFMGLNRAIRDLIPVTDENFADYMRDAINTLNRIEGILLNMIATNMKLINLDIREGYADVAYGRKNAIAQAKQLVDDTEKDIVHVNKDGSVIMDYSRYEMGKVYISKDMYNDKRYHRIMVPSRFLTRLTIYDTVIVAHGKGNYDEKTHKYIWTVEPITLSDGKQYKYLDDIIKKLRKDGAGSILAISCNAMHIVPDSELYSVVDFADEQVLFETAGETMLSTSGSGMSLVKSLQKYCDRRIKEIKKLEAEIITQIDMLPSIAATKKFKCIIITSDHCQHCAEIWTSKRYDSDPIVRRRHNYADAIGSIFAFYKALLFACKMQCKRLMKPTNEGAYSWLIKPTFQNPVMEVLNNDYCYDPTCGYQYDSLSECVGDILQFYGNGVNMTDVDISGINENAVDDLHLVAHAVTDPEATRYPAVPGTANVLFTKNITSESLVKIFQLAYMPAIPDGWKTMVKISTGEPGGHNYLKPELIGELVKLIHGTICDTVTAYEGGRDTKEGQLKTMKDHGFTEIGNVDVLDGDGELVVPVKNGYMLQDVNAGKNILGYDFHIILTHFKGHQMAGFGGSIKNVAIGCASRRGKSQIHTYGSTAEMTVGFLDQYDQQSFLKAMVDAAKSFVDVMKITGPILYINIANNMSVDCDCNAHPADPTMADLGIFASWDPVAVDSACIDAVYHAKDSKDLVERIESKDGTDILEYAQEAGMGSRSYHLINIDQVDQPMGESSLKSNIDPDYKAKGSKKLSSVKRIKADKAFLDEWKDHYKFLKHIDPNDDVYCWIDDDQIVAVLAIDHREDNVHFITAIEVSKSYQGYGIGNQVLEFAIKQGANQLSVAKYNNVAIRMYQSHGFKVTGDLNPKMSLMTLDETTLTEATKEYKRIDDIHPIDREEKKKIAEKYGLRAVGQELPEELREKEKTPEERYKELHEKRVKSLKKARKVKKRKAFTRKVKSHLPGVKNEDVELFYEDAEAVDNSDDSTPDGVEHSPLYGDKKDFFYNYDYPKDANSYAERLKLEESATKQEEEEPLTKQELASLGIRDLRTLQRWMKNNIRYKNFTQLMTPREVLKEKKGSCHDQVVFEMAALKALGYSPTAYFVLEHDDKPNNSQGGETHSYVVVKDNGKLYWLENAWDRYAGVNEITNPKFIRQAHKERAWGDSNKFKQLEVVRFAGQPGDSLQQLVDHCFNDKQEIDKPKKKESIVETGTPIWETYQFELEEPIQFLDRMDEAATTKTQKLYPVYIMLVHSGTAVSNAIKVVSHAEFSHAAISFDSSMDEMYSFARKDPRNPFIGGFRFESVGRGFYDNKHCPYAVYVVPCTETQIKKMKKRLNYFIQNQSKFKFDFVGLVKNYLGIVDNPEYRWFCSRFVADILNAGAPKKNPYVEEPSLQDPDDFKNTNYATYVIGGSDLMKYDQKLVDKRTKQILREEEMSRKVQNESVTYDLDRDNPFGDLVLGYQFAMMDESVVDRFLEYLKSFKLKFDKNGNIVIRRREYDQLDTHFRQSLKLIKAAEKAGNLDTVKYELCKIYYMISLIDRHYLGRKANDKSEKVRKDMINLRAVMINAMHQHLKYVSTMDPQFNFQSYYASTKYGDDTTISPQFLTAFGRTIVTALN